MGTNLLFEAEIFFFFSSVIAESFFLTEQKEKEIFAFRVAIPNPIVASIP